MDQRMPIYDKERGGRQGGVKGEESKRSTTRSDARGVLY
jgi:hypothetical protein